MSGPVRYDHLLIGGAWLPPEDGGFIESIDPAPGPHARP